MNETILTVTQLNTYVKSVLDSDSNLQGVFVMGEISNCYLHRSGHIYLTLKDENALIKAVVFSGTARRLPVRPENGMHVLVLGRISLYERDGQYQLYVDDLRPTGAGELNELFERLKRRLFAEGLFDESRKKPMPRYPKRIGIATSPTGAALQDMLHILKRRCPMAEVVFCPVQVQGAPAAVEICRAIEEFNRKKAADVLIIGRGGGSIEDLWAFNEESVARAVAASEIPIISAVGHETDYVISDFAADLRAPTPSAAAELVAPDMEKLVNEVAFFRERLTGLMERNIQSLRMKLNALRQNRNLLSPLSYVQAQYERLARGEEKMKTAFSRKVLEYRLRFSELASSLDMLSPLAVLGRGYAIAQIHDTIISSISLLKQGDSLRLRFSDGTAECTVKQITEWEHNRSVTEDESHEKNADI